MSNKLDEILATEQQLNEKFNELRASADNASRKRLAQIELKIQELEKKLNGLKDEQRKIFSSPIGKTDLLEMLKTSLQEGRKKFFIEEFLFHHVKKVQNNQARPLDDCELRNTPGSWSLPFAVITEQDLEQAVAMLPDVGVSIAERDEKIGKLIKQIKGIENEIQKELERI